MNSNEIFLVSGQALTTVAGKVQLSPIIEQRVVRAKDHLDAYRALAQAEPDFRPAGHSSLEAFESAAAQMRATLNGTNTEWKLLTAPSMA